MLAKAEDRKAFALYFDNLMKHTVTRDGGKPKNKDIAILCGYDEDSNIVSMWRRGRSNIPVEHLPTIATYLRIDEQYFIMKALETFMPNLQKMLADKFAHSIITDNELAIVKALRDETESDDPKMTTKAQMAKLKEFAASLEEEV